MYIPQQKRAGPASKKNDVFIICAVCIIFGLTVSVLIYFSSRYMRKRNKEPKYLPGKYLKRKWKQWCPGGASYGQVSGPPNSNPEQDTSYRGAGETAPEMVSTTGVRRETSVRSIITLPAYSPSPKPTEQIIGREGERNGMDMVVEYSETTEEQEARREEQMEALYQFRLQRRQELAEREARRRERREAQARGDTARLEQLAARRQRRQTGSNTSLDASTILAEHQGRERERRISTVSYAELGHVRHDGSRVRANSQDSDHHPLLQHAIVNTSTPSLTDSPSMHSRVQSLTSSILSASTAMTEVDTLALGQSTPRISNRPWCLQADERDLGTLNIPPPPDYEHLQWGEAPAYDDNSQAPQRPTLRAVSQIQVDVASPRDVSPVTLTETRSREMEDSPPTPVETDVPSAVA